MSHRLTENISMQEYIGKLEKRSGIVRPDNNWESTVNVSFGISANTINDNQ
jgi:hypothetical protein